MFSFRWKHPAVLGVSLLFWSVGSLAQSEELATGLNGSVHGHIRITRELTEQRMRFRLYPDIKPIAPPAKGQIREDEWANIVVYLKSSPLLQAEDGTVADEELEMVQLGETFIPHVLPIVRGSTVEFPNQDPIFHNVFSLSGTRTFDLGRYPKGESRAVTFDEAGVVPVFCHLHSDMSAVILVLENRFFAVPDSRGNYRIDNIPAGDYTVVAWHERSEEVEKHISIVAGQTVELDITVPVEDHEDSER